MMQPSSRQPSIRVCRLARSTATRPLRFAGTGGTAGLVQLLLLTLLTRHGRHPLLANAVAFLLAAQLNFALGVTFTWRDRWMPASILRRWVLFHASIALMALVNMLVFAAARLFLTVVVASLAGIAAGAVGNYVMGDRLGFQGRRETVPLSNQRRPAA